MAITREKIRGKEMILCEGKVDGFYVNPIQPEHIKTYTGGKNGPWTPTHRYNLIVDGQPISLGMGDKDGVSPKQQIRAKDNNGNYHTLVKGLMVSVEVEEAGEYNGKPQFRANTGNVIITDASGAEAAPAAAPAGAAPYKPKDMTGVEVGHAINGAMNVLLTFGGDASNDNIVRYAGSVHNVTVKLKKEVAAANPEKSEYDVGASVGHAILNACKLVGLEADFEPTLEGIAVDLLDNVVAPVEKYIKEGRGAAKPARRTPAPAKAPAAKGSRKAAKAPEPQPKPEDSGFDDMDDDSIPF